MEGVLRGTAVSGIRHRQCGHARLFKGSQPPAYQRADRKLEDLPALPRDRFILTISVFAICGREFRFLSKISAWRQGAAGAMETLRAIYRPRFGRSPGAGLRTDRIFA